MTVVINGTTGITSPEMAVDNGAADGGQVVLKSSGFNNWNIDNYSGNCRFYYNATELMRIDSSGNVGIGTGSPKSGTSPKMWITGSNTDSVPALQVEAGNQTVSMGFSYQKIMGSGDIYFTTNNDPSTIKAYIAASGNFFINSGYGSAAVCYGCRAWVNFNGTGTVAIRASGNVSSITDNGTGDYTVNYTTAMPDANYSLQGTTSAIAVGNNASYCSVRENGTISTSSTSVLIVNDAGSARDPLYVNIAVFR